MWRPTSDFMPWGGEDSNLRPADYEFDPAPLADQGNWGESGFDQEF